MTITATGIRKVQPPGAVWWRVVSVALDNSYASEGEPFSLQEAGFGNEAVFSHANCNVINLSEQATYRPTTASYDGTKIHVYDDATGKELASTKDVSKVTVQLEIYCTSN